MCFGVLGFLVLVFLVSIFCFMLVVMAVGGGYVRVEALSLSTLLGDILLAAFINERHYSPALGFGVPRATCDVCG